MEISTSSETWMYLATTSLLSCVHFHVYIIYYISFDHLGSTLAHDRIAIHRLFAFHSPLNLPLFSPMVLNPGHPRLGVHTAVCRDLGSLVEVFGAFHSIHSVSILAFQQSLLYHSFQSVSSQFLVENLNQYQFIRLGRPPKSGVFSGTDPSAGGGISANQSKIKVSHSQRRTAAPLRSEVLIGLRP